MNIKDCSIVIPSCDAYSDAWQPFFGFFFKYWPDCPFDIYLITEAKVFPDPRVKTLTLGKDYGWANNMLTALGQIQTKYFIYFLEDVFITKRVDTARIVSLLELSRRHGASCLRLYPSPGPDLPYEKDSGVGVIASDAPYRVSTMTAIWDKDAFIRVLKPGENAWQMELDGTKRSSKMDELFLSVYKKNPAIVYFATAIKRGKWFYDAVALCRREGIPVDVSKRPVEAKKAYLKRKFLRLPIVHGVWRICRKLQLCK